MRGERTNRRNLATLKEKELIKWLLLFLVLSRAGSISQVQTKFSLRNLSGDSVGIWWLHPSENKLIPQAPIAVRNSSSIEVNSYRGHEFVIRALPFKTRLLETDYVPEDNEVIMIVGATNDIVILNDEFQLIRRDAKFEIEQSLRSALALPNTANTDNIVATLVDIEQKWQLRWQEETRFRKLMENDFIAFNISDDQVKPPVPPPGGWPSERIDTQDWIRAALHACGGEPYPNEPAWYLPIDDQDSCAVWTPKYEASLQIDSHAWCGRWARVGECDKNPNYMRNFCRIACELFDDMAQPVLAVDILLDLAKRRDSFIACVSSALESHATKLRGAISAENNARTAFAEKLRNVTCSHISPLSFNASTGPHQNITQPAYFYDQESQRKIRGQHLFRASPAMPGANISLFTQFATRDECQYLIDTANRTNGGFVPATVNQEDDSAALSMSRRASASVVKPDPDDMYDPAAKLWRRAIHLANFMTGYNLDTHGQEPFSVIYYNGSKDLPDEYRPHCDGACDGSPHLHGGRVATLLLYCQTATRGGITTFTNARTVAAPQPNDAVFFSYFDMTSGLMDTGQTTHSGCPVLEGDKFVATLWLRKGVSKTDSWTQYDPTGARHDPRGNNPNLS